MASGIYPGLANKEAPFWHEGQNVMFTGRAAQPMPGQAVLVPAVASSPIRFLLETVIAGVRTVFYGNRTTLYKWAEGGTISVLGTGFDADYWTAFRWGEWTVMAPWPTGTVQVWKPGTGLADVGGRGGLFETARSVSSFRQFAIMLGVDGAESSIYWSAQDFLEDFVQTASNAAGKLPVQEAESPILACVTYSGRLFFATAASLFSFNFIGAPLYFGYNLAVKNTGVLGPYSMAVGGDGRIYGIGPSGVWSSDGQQVVPIDMPAVHERIYDRMNPANSWKCVVYHDMQTKQVFFCYPTDDNTENSEAVAWNYVDRNWAPSSQKRTAASDSGIFRSPILGDAEGNVWNQILSGVPASADQSADVGLTSSGLIKIPYGRGAYGRGPYGGNLRVSSDA